MSKFAALAAEIAEVRGTVASAIAFIQDLKQRIEDCEDDPEELAALVADLDAQQQALAAAIAANPDPPQDEPPADSPTD